MTTIATHSMAMTRSSSDQNDNNQDVIHVYSNGNECYQPIVINGGFIVWTVLLVVFLIKLCKRSCI